VWVAGQGRHIPTWRPPYPKPSNLSPRHGGPHRDASGALPARIPCGIDGNGETGAIGPASLRRSCQGLRGGSGAGRGGQAGCGSESSRGRWRGGGRAQEGPQEEAGLLE